MNWILKDRFSFVDIAVVLLATQILAVLDIFYLDWAVLIFVIFVFAYYIKACIDGIKAASNLTEGAIPDNPKPINPPPPLCRKCRPPAPPGPRHIKGKRG